MESLDLVRARRLALACAGLWPGSTLRSPQDVVEHFGYLQLDSVSVVGTRSHGLVLHSRLDGYNPTHAEALLQPGGPFFEYWGHEVSWMPLSLHPFLAFRRERFRVHPWWGNLLGRHPEVARGIRQRLKAEGPMKTADLEGKRTSKGGWWNLKLATQVATALWSAGQLAIRERRHFHRTWDLPERVLPAEIRRARPVPLGKALQHLLLRALGTHGWATTGTLTRTWRLTNLGTEVKAALTALQKQGHVVPCALRTGDGTAHGWIRPADLERAESLATATPDPSSPVLLSPFDPLLWDRARVQQLFGFEHTLEIYKPAPQRRWGYYVLPVLQGEQLVARVDLKAQDGRVHILSSHMETRGAGPRDATRVAVGRYARAVGLGVAGGR